MPDTGFRVGYTRIGDHRKIIDYRWLAIVVATCIGIMISACLVAVLIIKQQTDDIDDNASTSPPSDQPLAANQDFRLLRRPPYRDEELVAEGRNPAYDLPPIPGGAVESAYRKALNEHRHPSNSTDHADVDEDDSRRNGTCASSAAATLLRFLNAQSGDVGGDVVNTLTTRVQERTTELIKQQYGLSRDQIRHGMRSANFGRDNPICRSEKERMGRPALKCRSDQQFRTLDGSCNNLGRPSLGAAESPYRRGLQPDYADGVSDPRASAVDGGPLPDARRLSLGYHSQRDTVEDERLTSMSTFWGQFVAHDITKVKPNLETMNCCQTLNKSRSKSECFPMAVPSDDPFYSPFGVTCLEFVRSAPAESQDCTLGAREQVNRVTSYLDGSLVYGSSVEESRQLRTFQNGLLKTETVGGEAMLPSLPGNSSYCAHKTADSFCYLAGDGRCNENLLLTSLHTLFVRQHNRVAAQMLELNAGWDDERLFQEARRLVVAQIQHITYTHYLPRLLGAAVLDQFGLPIRPSEGETKRRLTPDQDSRYDERVDASISNEFATAAFRFGHATVPGLTQVLSDNEVQMFQLYRGLAAPAFLSRDNDTLAKLLNGAATQRSLRVDPYVSRQLTGHLFEPSGAGHGLDLVAINIQRGRDHGVPGYNAFRRYCGLPAINGTDGYLLVFDTIAARTFTQLYRSVSDLDLYVGGLSEPSRTPSGVLGPVFSCLVADQFARLRQGDRYWYENNATDQHPNPFTDDQLEQVRRTTLARLLCDNVPSVRNIQPDVFAVPTGDNSPEPCTGSRIPTVDLNYWEDEEAAAALFSDVATA